MKNRIMLTLAIAAIILFAATSFAFCEKAKTNVFPHQGITVLDKNEEINEPSGITYHPMRKTFFVVGDEGDLYEIDENAKILKSIKLSPNRKDDIDPEGITVNTRTGNLYIAAEEGDDIIEINPENFDIVGYYDIVSKKELFKSGGDGIEGITFVPGKDPEDDRVYVCNQYDPPIVMKVALPSKPMGNAVEKHPVPVIGYFKMPVSDLSDMTYHKGRKTLFILSDENNLIMEVTTDGKIIKSWSLPGKNQEGIAFYKGFMFIGQDSGKILRFKVNEKF